MPWFGHTRSAQEIEQLQSRVRALESELAQTNAQLTAVEQQNQALTSLGHLREQQLNELMSLQNGELKAGLSDIQGALAASVQSAKVTLECAEQELSFLAVFDMRMTVVKSPLSMNVCPLNLFFTEEHALFRHFGVE